jgi:hypothetical protein
MKKEQMVKVRMLKSASANDETKQIAMKTAKQTEAFDG